MQITNLTDKEIGVRHRVEATPEQKLAVAAEAVVEAFEDFVKLTLEVLDRVARGKVDIGQEPPAAVLEGARAVLGESMLSTGTLDDRLYELCLAIERIPPSPKQTDAILAATALRREIAGVEG